MNKVEILLTIASMSIAIGILMGRVLGGRMKQFVWFFLTATLSFLVGAEFAYLACTHVGK
jgi:hypothetical protein